MEFDDLLLMVGDFGRYQVVVYLLLCMFAVTAALFQISIIFIAAAPNHWCSVPELTHLNLTSDVIKNLTLPIDGGESYSQCYMYDRNYTGWTEDDVYWCIANPAACNASLTACTDWTYDTSVYTATVTTDFDLVCSRQWLQAACSSVYMFGFMLGSLFFGSLADIYGRVSTCSISFVLQFIFNLALAFSPNVIVYLVFRFLSAFFDQLYYTALVMALELVGPRWRNHVGIIIVYFWSFGYMLTPAIAYFFRDWRILQLVITLLMLVYIPYYWLIPESPRWLYSVGKTKAANSIMSNIAKWNKTEFKEPSDVTPTSKDKEAEEERSKGYIWDLFRVPWIRWRFINVSFNYFVNSMVYYGISLNIGYLDTNDYISTLVAGSVEIPAMLLGHVLLVFGGRRWPLIGTMIICGVTLIFITFLPNASEGLTLVAKSAVTISFTIIGLFNAELLPTIIRKIGVSTASVIGAMGGMVAPFIVQVYNTNPLVPPLVFGILSVVAGLLVIILPETKDRHIPEDFNDGYKLDSNQNSINPLSIKDNVEESQEPNKDTADEHITISSTTDLSTYL